jgi:hypothetical protein
LHLATGRSNCEVCSNPRGPPPLLSADTGSVIKIGALHISQLRVPFDGARRGSVQVGGRVAQPYSVVRTRDRVAGAGYACSAHTVCRSFPKISSALSVKACGRSRSAKRDGGRWRREGACAWVSNRGPRGLSKSGWGSALSGRVSGGTIDRRPAPLQRRGFRVR